MVLFHFGAQFYHLSLLLDLLDIIFMGYTLIVEIILKNCYVDAIRQMGEQISQKKL